MLILTGTHSSSHEKKKIDKVCIFSWNLDAWMFDILNEHIGIHQFDCYFYALLTWGYARET